MTHKLHASCSYTHAAIDALLALAAEHRLDPEQVREIVLRIAPSTRRATGDPGLRSCHAPRILAIALVRGRVAIEDVLRTADDEATARLQALVRVQDDPDLEPSHPLRCAAIVEVATGEGRRLVRRIDDPMGTAGNPLAAEETREKFRAAASRAQGGAEVERIADLVGRIEHLARIDRLAALLRRTPIHGD
jgi:2-methylcitrate dehydratase PrpD